MSILLLLDGLVTAIPLDLTRAFTRLVQAQTFIKVPGKNMPAIGALPDILANQKQTVGIDFGNFLPPGVTLSGTPTVSLSTTFGADSDPASRIVSGPFVGTANKSIGGTGLPGTAVLLQLDGCLPGVNYVVDVVCGRSDGDIAEASTRFVCRAAN